MLEPLRLWEMTADPRSSGPTSGDRPLGMQTPTRRHILTS